MRLTPLLAAFTLCSILLAGTAQAAAYPIRDRALTASKLYRSGPLQPSRCTEHQVKPNDVRAAKRYLTMVVNCLNRSWAAHFRRAGLPFTKARVGFITKPRRFCGTAWNDAAAAYCYEQRRFLVLLDRNLLDLDRGDERNKGRTHGKGRTIAAWLDKGFLSGSPAACNTWTAPSSRVS